MGCLYRLNFDNGKSYIGITSNSIKRRVILHKHHARKGRDCALHRAIRKYGEDSFSVEVLMIANDWGYLCEMEIKAIEAFNTKTPNGYNLTDGGEGTPGRIVTLEQREKLSKAHKGKKTGGRPKGFKHTEEAKRKISEAGRGRIFSAERRAKIGAVHAGNTYNLGKTIPPETRARMSAAQKGRKLTPEHIQKLRDSHKGKPWSDARRAAYEQRKAKSNG